MRQKPEQKSFTLEEITKKAEIYCAYQERCHEEVIQKLKTFTTSQTVIDSVIVHLIENNFLNEERFACSFARGKHRIKHWGKIRIVNELKSRHISKYNIDTALKEIQDEYFDTFDLAAEKFWDTISEKNTLKKRKKFCDFFLRKGFESNLIYEKAIELEKLS
ncbi:recombination regulator RecX [compost metagenome]